MPPKSAWSTQVDDEEASGTQGLAPLPAAFAAEPEAAFPSLGDAAKVVETKAERKKKQQKMSLADFNSLGAGGAAASAGKFSVAGARQRLQQREQDDILSKLPRGPRLDREPREEGVGLGGGFKEYGGDRGGSRYGDDRREDRGERRSGWGDREDGSQASDDGPSRADMADDWGAARKFTPSGADDRGERRGFGSGGFADREPRRGFGNRDGDVDVGPSRADTSDDWGRNRAALPAEPPRGSAFGERRSGGGFADRDGFRDRRDSDLVPGGGRADEAGAWGRSSPAASDRDSWGGSRRDGSAPPPGERPRLQLAPRTKPPPEIKVEARPAAPPELEAPPQPRAPRPNPFGGARPREEVLAQKTSSAAGSTAGSTAGSVTGSTTDDKPVAVDSATSSSPEGKPVEKAVDEAEKVLSKLSTEDEA